MLIIIIKYFEFKNQKKKSLFFKKIILLFKFIITIILISFLLNKSNIKINFFKLEAQLANVFSYKDFLIM